MGVYLWKRDLALNASYNSQDQSPVGTVLTKGNKKPL